MSRDLASASRWTLVAAILGSSMAFIDGTAVNVALPSIQHDFAADAASLQWVIEGYTLLLASLMLVGGALGDTVGRRRVFLFGIVGFAAASLACALAPSLGWLDAARCVQGAAAAFATPGSLALITAQFSEAERGKAIGTWSGFAAITGAVGPVLGGWFAQHASWRDVFLLNLPIAAAVVWLALRYVRESRDEHAASRIDGGGAALITAALFAVTYALTLQASQASAAAAIGTGVAGAAAFVVFIAWEARARAPMVPLAVFRNRTFAVANVYTLFLYAALGGSLYFVPFNLQNVQGYSPTAAGASMLPFIVIMFVSSRWSGGLLARIGARTPLVLGAALAGCGFLCYAAIGAGGSYWTTFFPASVVLGSGTSLFVAPLTTAVMNAAGRDAAGTASGINNAVSRIAALFAIAALGIGLSAGFRGTIDQTLRDVAFSEPAVVQIRTAEARLSPYLSQRNLPPQEYRRAVTMLRDAYVAGFRNVMITSALLAFGAAAFAFFLIPKKS